MVSNPNGVNLHELMVAIDDTYRAEFQTPTG